jgi:8-oxo-dGTP pyrophosphatase MutT (NUDIX family)
MVKLIQGKRVGKEGQIRTSSLVAIFNENREKIILTRRRDNGRWCLPGGGIEPGESAAEGAIRETLEEIGVDVMVKRLVGVYSSPDHLLVYQSGHKFQYVSMLFEVEIIGGEMGLSDEVSEYRYFSLAEIATADVMEHQVQRIHDAFSQQEAAFIR